MIPPQFSLGGAAAAAWVVAAAPPAWFRAPPFSQLRVAAAAAAIRAAEMQGPRAALAFLAVFQVAALVVLAARKR
jgi:hypothetical protein